MDPRDRVNPGILRLTEALEDPSIDLAAELHELGDALGSAVASYLGLTITFQTATGPVRITDWRDDNGYGAARSSVLLPLPLICDCAPGSTMVLYAGVNGAFVDLAADLTWATGAAPEAFSLDTELGNDTAPGAPQPADGGLARFRVVNQAIGVLIARGLTHDEAHDELRRLAGLSKADLLVAAEEVLASIRRPGAATAD